MNKNSFYTPYYQRAIKKKTNGLKLVLGGTGLGKTSGIKQTINTHSTKDSRKFIYIANRVQLLEEVKKDVGEDKCVHLKSNLEIFKEIDLLSFLSTNDLFKRYYNSLQLKSSFLIPFQIFIKEYQNILNLLSNEYIDEKFISQKISLIMSGFKSVLKAAYSNRNNRKISNNNFGFTQRDYDDLTSIKEVKDLFPYIEYQQNSNKKLLLITIHKAFRGFFTGKDSININQFSKKNGNRIIFMDEFDFLENDLLTLICEEADLQHPFKFVAAFYNAMVKNKLPSDKYLNGHIETKGAIEKITSGIELLSSNHGIQFPEITHFVCTNNEVKGKSIFQTNYTITAQPLYLNDTNRENSFDLTFEKTPLKAFVLFDIVKNAAIKIIKLFNDLENSNPVLYKELLRHCFETSEAFQKLIKTTQVHPKMDVDVTTNYEYFHYNGFSLYEIKEFINAQADTEEVKFKYYSIYQTPEKIILRLAKNNLVFGLSATAEIPRLVKNFDSNWLSKQLGDTYFELDAEDINDINSANNLKSQHRDNSIEFSLAKPDEVTKWGDFVDNFANSGCYDDEGNDVFKNNNKYCKDRLKYFLSTLSWIASQSRNEDNLNSHLLFFSSFKQIKSFFQNASNISEDRLYSFERRLDEDSDIEYFEITVDNVSSIVIFYDASRAKKIQKSKHIRRFYNGLFWTGKPILVLTTFKSTGNGVNLQYFSTREGFDENSKSDLKDFKHIHLLDAPFFYFNSLTSEDQEKESALIKENIYYLSKLEKCKELTQQQFKQHLNKIRRCGDFNREYIELTNDGLYNQLAIFIQALGRIERVWSKMPNQTIRMSDKVWNVFARFQKIDPRSFTKKKIETYFSNNLKELFKLIELQIENTSAEISDSKEEKLKDIDNHCKRFINTLLQRIHLLRTGRLGLTDSKKIRREWELLRQIALKHEFEHKFIAQNSCVFQTPYYNAGKLNINSEGEIIPLNIVSEEYQHWDLDAIYRVAKENLVIRRYFRYRGYQLGFDNNQKFFVPYFFQSILSGAIGEEAIKAILNTYPIELDDTEIPDSLYELADSKVKSKNWFIDFKNFGQKTLRNFPLNEEDPMFHPQLNEAKFRKAAKKKLTQLRNYYNSDQCKLIYINFLGERNGLLRYYDYDFQPTDSSFEKASIIVVPSVLSRDDADSGYNSLTKGFDLFINQLLENL